MRDITSSGTVCRRLSRRKLARSGYSEKIGASGTRRDSRWRRGLRRGTRGKRHSFGYPACPDLEDQASTWKLPRPQEIGAQLTEGFMMDPEGRVSALVFHHPDCTYFSVGETVPDQKAGETLSTIGPLKRWRMCECVSERPRGNPRPRYDATRGGNHECPNDGRPSPTKP